MAQRSGGASTPGYGVIAHEAAIMSAQHLARLERRRRLATLVAFAAEMEVDLTDATFGMVEKMVGSLFRRAERTRSERLMDGAKLLKETARVHVRLSRALIDAARARAMHWPWSASGSEAVCWRPACARRKI